MDSYPFYRAGRGSATPVLISLQDLPARLRNKPENVAMLCIMSYNMEIMSARMSRSETAISCIQTNVSKQVMPLSFIRLYTISSRAKGGYYKLPHDLLNSIK
ncbi:hypothetical protein PMAYCL1PPCAC_11152, partial [Pristionchus mayeri]